MGIERFESNRTVGGMGGTDAATCMHAYIHTISGGNKRQKQRPKKSHRGMERWYKGSCCWLAAETPRPTPSDDAPDPPPPESKRDGPRGRRCCWWGRYASRREGGGDDDGGANPGAEVPRPTVSCCSPPPPAVVVLFGFVGCVEERHNVDDHQRERKGHIQIILHTRIHTSNRRRAPRRHQRGVRPQKGLVERGGRLHFLHLSWGVALFFGCFRVCAHIRMVMWCA